MHYVLAVPAAVFAILVSTLASLHAQEAEPVPTGKLPRDVTPTHYSLDLEISPEADRYSGEVKISVNLEQPTQVIWLHGERLNIAEAMILTDDGDEVAATYQEIGETGVARLATSKVVGPGKAVLVMRYSAAYGKSLVGIYKAQGNGQTAVYSDFQPIDARQAFPAFDEPRFKTPFDVALTIDEGLTAISNEPEQERTTLADGRQRIVFATTKPLPTYLVTLAVGDFEIVEWDPIPPNKVRSRPVPLRGIAPKGKGEQMHYGLRNTAALLEILEEYFDSSYPYTKLDLVVPITFKASGMENAGAIFYRQDRFLIGERPPLKQLQRLANLHAHELAHSWVGNLVTPAWWDDLWLNEAFATWIASYAVHTWRPDDFDDRETQRRARQAMWNDRLRSTRQIRQSIESDHDIAGAFDGITYKKGGGVLTMVERFMGPDIFREGVRSYIDRHSDGVATAEDFFTALAESAGDTRVIQAFRSFIEQPGIPRLGVDWSCDDNGAANVTLKQSRSLPLGSRAEAAQQWSIPLCLAYPIGDTRQSQCFVMTDPTQSLQLETESCPAWIMPNRGGNAYLNFTLPDQGWDSLIADMDDFKPAEVMSIIGSLGAAYEAGEIDTEDYFDAARIAARSEHWDVVQAPMQGLRLIKLFVVPRELRPEVFKAMREIYRPALKRFDLSDSGLAQEEPNGALDLLRTDLIWFMAIDAEDPDLRAQLSRLGQAYMRYDPETGSTGPLDRDVLHPNLVRAALIVTTHELGLPFAEALIDRLRITFDPVLRRDIIHAIGHQTDQPLVERAWELILDPDVPRWQAAEILWRQGDRVDTSRVRLDWMIENYDRLLERLPSSHIASMPWRVEGLCDLDSRETVKDFFGPRTVKHRGGPRALANVLEIIELCTEISEAHRKEAVAAIGGG